MDRRNRFKTKTLIYRINPITGNLKPSSFNASSWLDDNTKPQSAQLYSNGNSNWKPSSTGPDEYLQIDLGYPETVYGVELSGNPTSDEYVTSYKVLYSTDGISFSHVLYHGQPEVILE